MQRQRSRGLKTLWNQKTVTSLPSSHSVGVATLCIFVHLCNTNHRLKNDKNSALCFRERFYLKIAAPSKFTMVFRGQFQQRNNKKDDHLLPFHSIHGASHPLEQRKELAPNQFGAILLQLNMRQLKKPLMCSFDHRTFLISYETCLNINIDNLINHHVGGEEIAPTKFGAKLYPREG